VNKNKEFTKIEIKNSIFTQPVKAGVSECRSLKDFSPNDFI